MERWEWGEKEDEFILNEKGIDINENANSDFWDAHFPLLSNEL